MDTEIIKEMLYAKILAPGKDRYRNNESCREIIREAETRLPPKDVFCLKMFIRAMSGSIMAKPQTNTVQIPPF